MMLKAEEKSKKKFLNLTCKVWKLWWLISLGDTFFCGKICIILSETIYQSTELLQLHNQRQVILHTHKTPSNPTSKPEVIFPAKKLRWLIDCLKPQLVKLKIGCTSWHVWWKLTCFRILFFNYDPPVFFYLQSDTNPNFKSWSLNSSHIVDAWKFGKANCSRNVVS